MPQIKLGDAEHQLAMDTVNGHADIMAFLEKCQRCGLPVEPHMDSVKTDCDFCKAVLENFFGETV